MLRSVSNDSIHISINPLHKGDEIVHKEENCRIPRSPKIENFAEIDKKVSKSFFCCLKKNERGF